MPKDKRECHETEQCGGHGEPSEWLARLQRFVATERRKNRPQAKYPRQRSEPTETARLAEVQLLERHIGSWVPCLDELLGSVNRWQAKFPAVVITTNPVGVTACDNLLLNESFHEALLRCCCLTENEYRYWCKQEPDVHFESHINYWAWIKTSVPAVRAKEFQEYPIAEGSVYWLLRHGVSGLGKHDFFDCKVFEWDGMKATLLTEHFREGVPSV
ncbi:hypothetical protein N9A79_01370 [Pirellulales bacterium]|nr:hypothetical protein [Pirellulales bacterium]